MKGTDFNIIKPYTYWIKDKSTGQKYVGVRWLNVKKKLSPNQDLGKVYFSSKHSLKKKFQENSNNFIYKPLATFDSKEEARDEEHKINKKNVKKNRYLNVAAWP